MPGWRAPDADQSPGSWRDDPSWNQGKAEWAVYDAQRVIYDKPRNYEATIFTNKQVMDPNTTTKAANADMPGGVEVFKHNVSEMIETDNYIYRFLTTSFVRTDDMSVFKISSSSQEDCGSTYRQVTARDGQITARQFGYFPDEGSSMASFQMTDNLLFHDALTVALRDFPFETADTTDAQHVALVQDLTDTHWVKLTPSGAMLEYVGTEQIRVPYGMMQTFHIRLRHNEIGGATESHYYFAVDPELCHVLVQYVGPFGLRYRLKSLDWWAYWSEPQPDKVSMKINQTEVTQIAIDEMHSRGWTDIRSVETRQHGDRWLVSISYDPPTPGGHAMVEISETGKVIVVHPGA